MFVILVGKMRRFSAGSYTSTAKFGLHKMQKQKSRHSEDTDVGERLTGRRVS